MPPAYRAVARHSVSARAGASKAAAQPSRSRISQALCPESSLAEFLGSGMQASSSHPAAAGCKELGHRCDQNDAEENFRCCCCIADVPALKADFIDEQNDGQRSIVGTAKRHDLSLPEQLKL